MCTTIYYIYPIIELGKYRGRMGFHARGGQRRDDKEGIVLICGESASKQ